MKLVWQVDADDAVRVRAFVEQYHSDPLVRYRVEHNITCPPNTVTVETFWEVAVGCLLTTQQRSGPDSAIVRLQNTTPFPLSYDFCTSQKDMAAAARVVLQEFGGIRRYIIIAKNLAQNFASLQAGLWLQIETVLRSLMCNHTPADERTAAEFMDQHLAGFGPKQSRNLLQSLGLTQYEIPIDSRIVKWLRKFGFPLDPSAAALSDIGYYNLISDGIQTLCREAGVLPCVLDAAIFTSFDNGGWTDDNVV